MGDYYWCLQHETVERERTCRAATRLGPYDTPEEARGWRERTEARDDAWEEADRRWHGEDERD